MNGKEEGEVIAVMLSPLGMPLFFRPGDEDDLINPQLEAPGDGAVVGNLCHRSG